MTLKFEFKKRKKSQSLKGPEKRPYNGRTPAPGQFDSLKKRVGGDLIHKSKSLYRKKLPGTELLLHLSKKGTA